MLRGVFRTKEGKIIAVVLGFIIVVIFVFSLTSYSESRQFVEQAVMAENYLKAGSYEQAAEAYLKALSMKNSDEQLLTIGLAEAYVGMNNYDKALEVLRSCYQKTSGIKIKEKIEVVTSEKTDYEYHQSISRAEVYFSNKEYDKAIAEFEKAKLIKSKEVTSYRRIAEAYIEKGEYNLAKEEVLEGQELTGDESLDVTLDKVESYLLKQQYETLVTEASEYIYQENYEDGVAKYKEAIRLLPEESAAYQGLAEAYMVQEDYSRTIILLQDAISHIDSEELQDILNKAMELKEAEDEKNNILSKLFKALKEKDFATVAALMDLTSFKENIVGGESLAIYSEKGNTSKNPVLIIYDSDQLYYGNLSNGIRNGSGIYFLLTKGGKAAEYYCYDGEWKSNIPGGEGRTEEVVSSKGQDGDNHSFKTVTEGKYDKSLEEGDMKKVFYTDGDETEWVEYQSQRGVPQKISDQNQAPSPTQASGSYMIGALYRGDQPTGEYYSVEPQTVWGVKPFLK
jgi:tetratricopeptide (TPR) repeat protein